MLTFSSNQMTGTRPPREHSLNHFLVTIQGFLVSHPRQREPTPLSIHYEHRARAAGASAPPIAPASRPLPAPREGADALLPRLGEEPRGAGQRRLRRRHTPPAGVLHRSSRGGGRARAQSSPARGTPAAALRSGHRLRGSTGSRPPAPALCSRGTLPALSLRSGQAVLRSRHQRVHGRERCCPSRPRCPRARAVAACWRAQRRHAGPCTEAGMGWATGTLCRGLLTAPPLRARNATLRVCPRVRLGVPARSGGGGGGGDPRARSLGAHVSWEQEGARCGVPRDGVGAGKGRRPTALRTLRADGGPSQRGGSPELSLSRPGEEEGGGGSRRHWDGARGGRSLLGPQPALARPSRPR